MTRARSAALAVCARANDTTDARMLLSALGLLVDGHLDWPEPGLLEIHDIKNVAATGAGGAGFR